MAARAQLSPTDHAILACLTICPMSGYELREFIASSIGNFWAESFGQLYPALKRLQSQHLAHSSETKQGKRRKITYTLTPAGHDRLRSWLDQPAAPQVPRSELLLKLFFASETSPSITLEHIARHQTATEKLLTHYHTIRGSLNQDHANDSPPPNWLATLRF